MLDNEYIALIRETLEVTTDASEKLLRELLAAIESGKPEILASRPNTPERVRALDVRRAEIWKQALDAAGIVISRKEV